MFLSKNPMSHYFVNVPIFLALGGQMSHRKPICIEPWVSTSGKVILVFFFVFFQDLCEFARHFNKRHIFLCLFVLFAHYYCNTGRNEAIIVELRVICFEWHFYHFNWGVPSLNFLQLKKIVPALAFNFIIVATNA